MRGGGGRWLVWCGGTHAPPPNPPSPRATFLLQDDPAPASFGLVGAPFAPLPGRRLPPARPFHKASFAASAAASSSSSSPSSSPPSGLTHVDAAGRAAMVDVSLKPATRRVACATGRVVLGGAAFDAVRANAVAKGDVLAAARLAAVLGAKATPSIIPLCHPLPLASVDVDVRLDEAARAVEITATTTVVARTGVEMEALTAVAAAALTVYDMTKAICKESSIEGVRLVAKEGGKSGAWRAKEV